MSNLISLEDKRKAKGRGRRGRKKDLTLEQQLAALNAEFGVVNIAGKVVILHKTHDAQNKPVVEYMTVESFRIWMLDDRVFDGETDRATSIGELWMKSPGRRKYHGVDFAPDNRLPDGWFNLWRGFTIDAAAYLPDRRDHAKHFATLFDHVLNNIASGNQEHARWIWAWFAHMVQRPCDRVGTALILQGKQGTGKSKLGQAVGRILGNAWVPISKGAHLTGHFNAHMRECLLLQAEEAFWAGDKAAEGALKDLISSDYHMLEEKGLNAVKIRNLTRLMVTSNNEWVVPAALEDRRMAVFRVGENRIQDHAYFKKIDDELDDGGLPHLLSYLLRFDLDGVDFWHIPKTAALYEQKVASMDDFQAWWFDRLLAGVLFRGEGDWTREVAGYRLHRAYCDFADRIGRGRKKTPIQFGLALKLLVPQKDFKSGQQIWQYVYGPNGEDVHNIDGTRSRERVKGYHLPSLDDCRKHFEGLIGAPVDWGESGGDSAEKSAETSLSVGNERAVEIDHGAIPEL